MRLSKPFAQSARWRFVLLGVIVTFCRRHRRLAVPTRRHRADGSPDAAGQAEGPAWSSHRCRQPLAEAASAAAGRQRRWQRRRAWWQLRGGDRAAKLKPQPPERRVAWHPPARVPRG